MQERGHVAGAGCISFGDYRTPEVDVTPALGVTLIVAVVALIIHTGI